MDTVAYGYIIKIKQNAHAKSFIIADTPTGLDLEIFLPPKAFCPAVVGDTALGTFVNFNGTLHFPHIPVIEIPLIETNIKKTIMSSLYGTSYNKDLIDRTYTFFKDMSVVRMQTDKNIALAGNTDSIVAETITSFSESFRIDKQGTLDTLSLTGLTIPQCERLMIWWRNKYTMRKLYLLGLTRKEIRESYDRGWDPTTLHKQLIKNPYIVETVPYEKAIQIVQRYFLQLPEEYKTCGQIVRYVDQMMDASNFGIGNGWVCFPMYLLQKTFVGLFQLQDILKTVFRCAIRYNFLYLHHQAEAEDILNHVMRSEQLIPTCVMPDTLSKVSEEQAKCIDTALNNSITIITGPGGTGKTTTLAQLCQELEFRDIDYLVCTFTGKASARVKQVIHNPAKIMTLSMVLARPSPKIKVLIVDETSQVDNVLMASVLKKLNVHRVVMFGDPRQLQPFSGDMFNQLITSERIPHTKLTEDRRRRNKNSPLFMSMKALAEGRPEDFSWGEDCHFIAGDAPEVLSCVASLATSSALSNHITVICPYNAVNEELNIQLQEIFLPSGTVGYASSITNTGSQPTVGYASSITDQFGKTWRIGARVMMLANRHEIEVMNGEEGTITEIDYQKSQLRVQFNCKPDGELIDIPTFTPVIIDPIIDPNANPDSEDYQDQALTTKQLALSWALTPDKAQGSQWEKVIVYLPVKGRSYGFLHKKRVYTALSRAAGELYVITRDESSFRQMLATEPSRRFDCLSMRLTDVAYKSEYINPSGS